MCYPKLSLSLAQRQNQSNLPLKHLRMSRVLQSQSPSLILNCVYCNCCSYCECSSPRDKKRGKIFIHVSRMYRIYEDTSSILLKTGKSYKWEWRWGGGTQSFFVRLLNQYENLQEIHSHEVLCKFCWELKKKKEKKLRKFLTEEKKI